MNPQPVVAPPSITIRELVEEYVYRYHFKMFPVIADAKLLGCITTRQVKAIPREEWEHKTVAESIDPVSAENTVVPATTVIDALSIMGRTGNSRLMVAEGDRLVGIITLKDIMGYLAEQMELEGKE
jgi:predicted transcriptional regulator